MSAEEPIVLPDLSERLAVVELGNGRRSIELRDAAHVFSPQQNDVWCWAACAAMIHALNGKTVTQEEIVLRVQGAEALAPGQERGATFFEVVRALTPELGDRTFTEVFQGRVDEVWGNFSEGKGVENIDADSSTIVRLTLQEKLLRPRNPAIEDLELGHAAVAGLKEPGSDRGHLYVLVGATYRDPVEGHVAQGLDQLNSLAATFDQNREIAEARDAASPWVTKYAEVLDSPEAKALFEHIGLDRYDTDPIVLLDPYVEDAEQARVELSGPAFMERVQFVLSASDAKELADKWTSTVSIETKPMAVAEDQ